MRRLTEHQVGALEWCRTDGSRHWGGPLFGAPNKRALSACVRQGWIARVGHPDMDLYAITEAGRLALAEQEKRHA